MAPKVKVSVRLEGLRELERALAELPKATARNVLKRTLMKAGQPIAEEARRLVPVDEGHLRDSIAVSAKIKNTAGKAEFAEVMRQTGSYEAAVAAMRSARRVRQGSKSFAEVYVGAGQLPHAHLVEFGSVHNTPQPYLRPAFDGNATAALEIVKAELGGEIDKAARRIARKAARTAKRR